MNNLEQIKEKLSEYENIPQYCFKLCKGEWLIVLRKMIDTQTNENREGVVDHKYAKFRADKLFCVKIVNVNIGWSTNEITNEYDKIETKYKVGSVVESHKYEKNSNLICAPGIHYFKTIDGAYYYRDRPHIWSGEWRTWMDNGQKATLKNYMRGEEHGLWVRWYSNGKIWYFGDYVYGKEDGLWTINYDDGHKGSIGTYSGGKKNGLWLNLYKNGQFEEYGMYKNDNRHGTWCRWSEDGSRLLDATYENGIFVRSRKPDELPTSKL